MAKTFIVSDNRTGKEFEITSEDGTPPTEDDVASLFSQYYAKEGARLLDTPDAQRKPQAAPTQTEEQKGKEVRTEVAKRRAGVEQQVKATPKSAAGKLAASVIAPLMARANVTPRSLGLESAGGETGLATSILGPLSDAWSATAGVVGEGVDRLRGAFDEGYADRRAAQGFEQGVRQGTTSDSQRAFDALVGIRDLVGKTVESPREALPAIGEIGYELIRDPAAFALGAGVSKGLAKALPATSTKTLAARLGAEAGSATAIGAVQSGGDVDPVGSLAFSLPGMVGLRKELKAAKAKPKQSFISPDVEAVAAKQAADAEAVVSQEQQIREMESRVADPYGVVSAQRLEGLRDAMKSMGRNTDEVDARIAAVKAANKRGPVVGKPGAPEPLLAPEAPKIEAADPYANPAGGREPIVQRISESPQVKAAEVRKDIVTNKAEEAVQISQQTADITQSPESLDIKEAQKALTSPEAAKVKATQEVQAANENLRTAEQTAAKQVEAEVIAEMEANPPDLVKEKYPAMSWDEPDLPVDLPEIGRQRLRAMIESKMPEAVDDPRAASALARWAGLDGINDQIDLDIIERKLNGPQLNSGIHNLPGNAARLLSHLIGQGTFWTQRRWLPTKRQKLISLDQGSARNPLDEGIGTETSRGLTVASTKAAKIRAMVRPEVERAKSLIGMNRKVSKAVADALEGRPTEPLGAGEMKTVQNAYSIIRETFDKFKEDRKALGLPVIEEGYMPRMADQAKLDDLRTMLAENKTDNPEFKRVQQAWVDAYSKQFEDATGKPPTEAAINFFKEEFGAYLRGDSMRESELNAPTAIILDHTGSMPKDQFKSTFSRKRFFSDPPLPVEYYERNPAIVLDNYVYQMARELSEAQTFGPGGDFEGVIPRLADRLNHMERMSGDKDLSNDIRKSVTAQLAGRIPKTSIGKVGDTALDVSSRVLRASLLSNFMTFSKNFLFATLTVPSMTGASAVPGLLPAMTEAAKMVTSKARRAATGDKNFTSAERSAAVNMALFDNLTRGSNDTYVNSVVGNLAKKIESGALSGITIGQAFIDLWGYHSGKIAFDADVKAARSGNPAARKRLADALGSKEAARQIKEPTDLGREDYAIWARGKSSGKGEMMESTMLHDTTIKRRLGGFLAMPIEQTANLGEVIQDSPGRFLAGTAAGLASSYLAMYAIYSMTQDSDALAFMFGTTKEKAKESKKKLEDEIGKSALLLSQDAGSSPFIGNPVASAVRGLAGKRVDNLGMAGGLLGYGFSSVKTVPAALTAGKPLAATKALLPGLPARTIDALLEKELMREERRAQRMSARER